MSTVYFLFHFPSVVVQVKKEKHNCSEFNYVELHVLLVKPQCLMCKTPSLFHGTRTGQFILAPVVILSYFCIGIPSAWLNLLPGGIWHVNSRFNRWKFGLNQKNSGTTPYRGDIC